MRRRHGWSDDVVGMSVALVLFFSRLVFETLNSCVIINFALQPIKEQNGKELQS
jgi:hypothetical protein